MFNWNIFKKKIKPEPISEHFLVCNLCIYNDETCSLCAPCEGRYGDYPTNFIARRLPKYVGSKEDIINHE